MSRSIELVFSVSFSLTLSWIRVYWEEICVPFKYKTSFKDGSDLVYKFQYAWNRGYLECLLTPWKYIASSKDFRVLVKYQFTKKHTKWNRRCHVVALCVLAFLGTAMDTLQSEGHVRYHNLGPRGGLHSNRLGQDKY